MDSTLKEKSIKSLMFQYIYPSLIGMVISGIYTTIDGIFIGQGIGSTALAAINIAFPPVMIIFAFIVMISMGGSIMMSQSLGKGNKSEGEKYLGTSIYLLLIFSLACPLIAIFFGEKLLILCGADNTTLKPALAYFNVRMIFVIFESFATSFNSFVRNDGNPNLVKKAMAIGAICNIILDAVFIFIFKAGVGGAAIATVISQAIVAIMFLKYFLSNESNLKIIKEHIIYSKVRVKEICYTGISSFGTNASYAFMIIIHNILLLQYGTVTDVSAYGVLIYIYWIFLLVYNGIGQGIQPIISYNYGANLHSRVKETIRLSSIFTILVGILSCILILINPEFIIGLFNSEPELVSATKTALYYYLIVVLVNGFNLITAIYFQSINKLKLASILTFSRTVFFVFPFILILPKFWGTTGIWLSVPIAETLCALWGGVLLFKSLK